MVESILKISYNMLHIRYEYMMVSCSPHDKKVGLSDQVDRSISCSPSVSMAVTGQAEDACPVRRACRSTLATPTPAGWPLRKNYRKIIGEPKENHRETIENHGEMEVYPAVMTIEQFAIENCHLQ